VGGFGDDTLTGGTGADIFAFIKGELSVDTVTDFSKTAGDKLDLTGLLSGAGMDKTKSSSVANYLSLERLGTSNDAVLKVNLSGLDGDVSFTSPDQKIILTNGWTTGGLNEDINQLIAHGVILA
jgi:Ca2+-binding RTX toxin-like protein